MIYFQDLIHKLSEYWASVGCAIQFGYDLEMGAGTFNPATFFKSLGPEPYSVAYVEPSRRPTDGRYGDNPNRLQHYFQYQVLLKPSPPDIQALYLGSLKALGFPISQHDIRFIHDDWKSPTLGAWGLGWEVQIDGMEVSQFTYFQNMGGLPLETVSGEITYGLERLAMYLQNVDSVYDIQWNKTLTYGDVYHQSEIEWSTYNFEEANIELWKTQFESYEKEVHALVKRGLPIPAYDFVMKASHSFNILDARGVISVTERTGYINRIRSLSCLVARDYLKAREEKKFPLLKEKKEKSKAKLALKKVTFKATESEDFVLEIGCEELPHSFVPIGINNLKKDLEALFKKLQLSHGSIKTYGTPRRLVAYVDKLAKGTPEIKSSKKGPPANRAFDAKGELTPLGKGFFASQNIESVTYEKIKKNQVKGISLEEIKGEEYLKVEIHSPTQSTYQLLSEELPSLILNLEFPQKMIWSDLKVPFPRPLKWLLALHGKEVLDFEIANITSSNKSQGHPALSPQVFTLKTATDYFKETKHKFVIVDQNERKDKILTQLTSFESKYKAKVIEQEKVLQEVLYLTEYPELLLGDFDQKYLEAPKELLSLVMITHQRYFPLEDSKGNLLPYFIVCLDNKQNSKIKAGHEKAITPRLADGLFVYEQDLRMGLTEMSEKLSHIAFQKGLGNLNDKAKRLGLHARSMNVAIQASADLDLIQNTALFLKADLASHLVFEFPELQGIIGRHYAEIEKYPTEMASAIEEHWLPRFEEDRLPETPSGILFALSDKMDNLLACFMNGHIPSSSSDPYALRRQTLGIIRILIEHKIHMPLMEALKQCASHFDLPENPEALSKLKSFIESRLQTVLKQYKLRPDEIQSVLAEDSLDIYDLYLRAKALHQFKANPQFTSFMEVFKRAKGQLNIAIKQAVDPKLFSQDEEEDLYEYLVRLEPEFLETIQDHQYEASFILLSSLHPYLSHLFDKVKIMVEDDKLRMNRLALLNQVLKLFSELLDFSLVLSELN